MNKTTPGTFIVLEGPDGAGKSTQATRLLLALARDGHDVLLTREPWEGPLGEQLRRLLSLHPPARTPSWQRLALLFAAARLEHLEEFVLPALARGTVVVSDRYDLSSYVYQASDEDKLCWVRTLNACARRPDLTLVLTLPEDELARRLRLRPGQRDLFDLPEHVTRNARVYAQAQQLVPDDRLVMVRGDVPVEVLATMILEEVRKCLSPKASEKA
jgi:dTMP kinase